MADAESAREALADGKRYDLILSDVSLPGEDGISFASWLADTHPEIPVVLMSGNFAMQMDRHGPPPVGVRTLDKPFGLGDLRRIVGEVARAD